MQPCNPVFDNWIISQITWGNSWVPIIGKELWAIQLTEMSMSVVLSKTIILNPIQVQSNTRNPGAFFKGVTSRLKASLVNWDLFYDKPDICTFEWHRRALKAWWRVLNGGNWRPFHSSRGKSQGGVLSELWNWISTPSTKPSVHWWLAGGPEAFQCRTEPLLPLKETDTWPRSQVSGWCNHKMIVKM